jgi:hypothetical protein
LIFEKQAGKIAVMLVVLLIALPFGVGYFTTQNHGNNIPLKLYLSGAVTKAGNQNYSIGGGRLISGTVLNYSVDPITAKLHYSVQASVSGMNSKGVASVDLTGTLLNGKNVSLTGIGSVENGTSAFELPNGCKTNCTSFIPASFIAYENFSVIVNGVTLSNQQMVPTAFESPYLDPFGSPILVTTLDGGISLLANYSVAKVNWSGSTVSGTVWGNYGSGSGNITLSGLFVVQSNNTEDLVSGTQVDSGKVLLYQMNPARFDSSGNFSGNSSIPASTLTPCDMSQGLPAGSCSQSGLESEGSVSLLSSSGSSRFSGNYLTIWATPAINSTSALSAQEIKG